jgi:hypothetical protein
MQTLPDAWVLACRYGDVATAGYLEREINWRVARRHRTQPGRQVEEPQVRKPRRLVRPPQRRHDLSCCTALNRKATGFPVLVSRPRDHTASATPTFRLTAPAAS